MGTRAAMGAMSVVVAALAGLMSGAAIIVPSHRAEAAESPLVPFTVVGDAIPSPLGGFAGDADRGRRIVVDREVGNCLICHAAPEPAERFMGDVGPDLAGVGRRLTPGQIRLRLVDQSRLNPATTMPPFYRIDALTRVAARYRGRPVLTAAQIEDVVAYLARLVD